ncbi:MAG: hypothetical protein IPK12_19400 [Gemmatimonadetes bacterium]|nr:hypothetical protein [Gemmatimonadota bacterium]
MSARDAVMSKWGEAMSKWAARMSKCDGTMSEWQGFEVFARKNEVNGARARARGAGQPVPDPRRVGRGGRAVGVLIRKGDGGGDGVVGTA